MSISSPPQIQVSPLQTGYLDYWNAGTNDAANERAQSLNDLVSALSAQSQFQQNDRYAQETPYEIMKRRLEGETAQAKSNSSEFMNNVVPTAVAEQNYNIASNTDKAHQAKLDMFTRVSDMILGGASPLDLQMKGFDPDLVNSITQLAQSGQLEDVNSHIKQRRSITSEKIGKDDSEAVKQEAERRRALEVQRLHNQGMERAASVRGSAEKAAERIQYLREVAAGVIVDPKIPPEKAQAVINQIRDDNVAKASASKVQEGENTKELLNNLKGNKGKSSESVPSYKVGETKIVNGVVYTRKQDGRWYPQ